MPVSPKTLKIVKLPNQAGIYQLKISTSNVIFDINVLNVNKSMPAEWNKNKQPTHKKKSLYIYDD